MHVHNLLYVTRCSIFSTPIILSSGVTRSYSNCPFVQALPHTTNSKKKAGWLSTYSIDAEGKIVDDHSNKQVDVNLFVPAE